MIDLKIIRENPDLVKANCVRRGFKNINVDEILETDENMRRMIKAAESLRAERNKLSNECRNNPDARIRVKNIKEELSKIERDLLDVESKLKEKLSWLPNFFDSAVPDGKDDSDNREIRKCGNIAQFSFKAKDHQEIGEKLGILDTLRGAKVAESGFYYWKGKGARLCSALFFWAQNFLAERGFTEFMTPCLAKEQTLFGTGYLPFFADQTYKLENCGLALIGTSEQTLVGYHADETLSFDQLPLLYTAFTPCFRTEAGSYGKVSKGIFRVHQFHKVEQIIFCLPENSNMYHEFCLKNEEDLLVALGLPYRVMEVCVGDLGAPGYRKYDVEVFFPGFGGYREVTSNTNITDFQSRRLNIRYKTPDGQKGYVHTISATAVTDRFAIAILENYQQEDGSVIVPEVLRKFTGFDKI